MEKKENYKQILDKLSALILNGDLERVEKITDIETAINELDKIQDFYYKNRRLLEDMMLLENLDEDAKKNIDKVIGDVGFKIALLDDEFDCRGWTIFDKKLTLSYYDSKVKLKKAQPDDAEILTIWWNDGKIMAHAGFPNGVGTTVEKVRENIVNRPFYNLLFIIYYGPEPIGEMSANISNGVADFGIKICNDEYQNQGIGPFAMKKFFKELFSSNIVDKIKITTNINNERAIHVYKDKLKVTEVKRYKFQGTDGKEQESVEFELTKSQWEEMIKMENCIFCKIIKGEISSNIVYQDDDFVIFPDLNPKAKLHYLAVPRKHFALLSEMTKDDEVLLGRILAKIPTLSTKLGLDNGYRIIVNQKGEKGNDVGQEVMHLHIHILGGEKLSM